MAQNILQAVLICAGTWFLWKLFRRFFVKTTLDNVPGPTSTSFLYGNYKQILSMNSWGFHRELLDRFPSSVTLLGSFGVKMLYTYDPLALHHILIKDQYTYEESTFFLKSHDLTLGPALLSSLGDAHKKQRKLLNPVFSPKYMRDMVPIFYDVVGLLQQAIEQRVKEGPAELDMAEWMGRTALELVGQAGLGYSFDPLVSDRADAFGDALKSFSQLMHETAMLRRLLRYVPTIRPFDLGHKFLQHFPHEGVRRLTAVADTLHQRSIAIVEAKRRAIELGDEAVAAQVGAGKDILSVLLRANMSSSEADRLSEEEVIAQLSTLVLAAMDTTSTALSRILTVLAEHPDVQQKLREELLSTGADKGLDYDTLSNLPYMDAICRETLRLTPPVSQVFRETRKDVVLPLSEPIIGTDGQPIKEILLEKDTVIVVGLLNANRNKAIWGEDALEWKPERWLNGLPKSVTDAKMPGVYSNLMTFLGGGRACIGFKFSQLEMKVVLAMLVSKFNFEKSDKEIVWNSSGVQYPSVGKHGTKPSLPMKVGLAKMN
ncbi:cytochrome P450 [Earliella scabrosa]|nr:cytochrome P450 [Earliella scabrosa]